MELQGQQPAPRPASLLRALGRGLEDVYDHLGLVMVSSFIWFISAAAPVLVGVFISRHRSSVFALAGFAVAFLLSMPIAVGAHAMARHIVLRDDPSLADLKTGFKDLLGPALKLGLADLIVTSVLIVDAMLFLARFGPLKQTRLPIGPVLGVFFLYLLMMWLATLPYHLPLLVWQRPKTFAVIKRAFLLAAANPVFTMGLLFAMILLAILCAATGVGVAVLFVGAAAVLTAHCLHELFVRYGIVEEENRE